MALRKQKKVDPLAGVDAKLPDKQLYDKAQYAIKKGRYDVVARLDLQTLLNTYPDSQYQMRAKLSIADSWYSEGGSGSPDPGGAGIQGLHHVLPECAGGGGGPDARWRHLLSPDGQAPTATTPRRLMRRKSIA